MKIILSDNTEVEVECYPISGAFDTQGINLESKKVFFSKSIHAGSIILKDAIESIQNELEKNKPHSIEIQIGLNFGTEGNVIFSKGTAEAAISIKATWRNEINEQ